MQIKQRQLTQISTGERSIFRSTYMLKKIRRFIPPYGLKYFHFSWRVQTIGRKLFWLSSRHSTSRISLSHKKKYGLEFSVLCNWLTVGSRSSSALVVWG